MSGSPQPARELAQTAPGCPSPPNCSPASFAKVEIAWPGFYLKFEATRERIDRVMKLLIPEVLAAEAEFEAAKKAKQENRSTQIKNPALTGNAGVKSKPG